MRVNREELLKVLESVVPGLSNREVLEQSTCFAFRGGRVFTFNDEVACTRSTELDIEGAVKAEKLRSVLSQLPDDDVDIVVESDDKGTRLKIKCQGKRSCGMPIEKTVALPIDEVETPNDADWRELPDEFGDAVRIVHSCASRDQSQFDLTCVHMTGSFMEACDRFQMARYQIESGIDGDVLVRAASLKSVADLGMVEICESDHWLHFRNRSGLIVSCRRFINDSYHDLSPYLQGSGDKIVLPGGLEEIIKRAEIFSVDNVDGNTVLVDLNNGWISLKGEGPLGWYMERKQVEGFALVRKCWSSCRKNRTIVCWANVV